MSYNEITTKEGDKNTPTKDDILTPTDTSSMNWAIIEEVAQRKHNVAARALFTFKRDEAFSYRTEKGDQSTDIIDQGEKVTYNFPPAIRHQLMRHLEACRLEGSVCHDSERQGTPNKLRSGTMLDFDIITTQNTGNTPLQDRHMYRLINALVGRYQQDLIVGGTSLGTLPNTVTGELIIHIFFIVKPALVPVTEGCWKFGFHIVIPSPMLNRTYKKWLIRQLRDDPSIITVMRELGARDPPACLDQNSASVPVLYFGSCKRGGTPYKLAAAFEVIFETIASKSDEGCMGHSNIPSPVIRKLTQDELAPYNLVYEMSVTNEAVYADGRTPLVRKVELECNNVLRTKIEAVAQRTQDNIIDNDTLLMADNRLSTLTMHDAEAQELHGLLDLLTVEYYTKYQKWRDVLYALANTSESYRPLAEWFSYKCPRKWVFGGTATAPRSQTFEQVWQDAVNNARKGVNAVGVSNYLTKRSITHWARECDPVKYREVTGKGYFAQLMRYVYDYDGCLEHAMMAKVLLSMLGQKFCVDVEPGVRAGSSGSYIWFEFVIAGQTMKSGEVWKYRREAEPDEIYMYLSHQISKVLEQVQDHLKEKQDRAKDEIEAKYYKEMVKTFKLSRKKMHNDQFQSGVIKQCRFLFRRRGFLATLDKHPDLLGVQQGVLKLGTNTTLLDHFHENSVSMFTSVCWHPFDPDNNPWDRVVIDMVESIIPEPDARDWILFYQAQTVHGGSKEGIILFWEGGGQNGKTTLLKAIAKALGPYWKKFNINLLVSDRENANEANSALMVLKGARGGYVEELNKTVALNVARMKEIVNPGDITGRELHSRQEEFSITCNITVASQYSFTIDTRDHGTWRRVRHYTSKVKFRKKPDPNNPFEKKDDQRFIRAFPEDPEFQSSMLSLLVYYYERLLKEYGGEIKNVPSSTIDRESEIFRNSQDTLNRFISEMVVVSPNSDMEYTLATINTHYSEWFNGHIDLKRHIASEIIKEVESSALAKYLKPHANRTLILSGCRILTREDTNIREGETFLTLADVRGKDVITPIIVPASRSRWWEPEVKNKIEEDLREPGGSDDNSLINDDCQLLQAEKDEYLLNKKTENDLVVDELFTYKVDFTCDDVYQF